MARAIGRHHVTSCHCRWSMSERHEAFGARVIAGKIISQLGALALLVSNNVVLAGVTLSPGLNPIIRWH